MVKKDPSGSFFIDNRNDSIYTYTVVRERKTDAEPD